MEQDIQTLLKLAAYAGGGICIGFGAIGAAVGEGYTASRANEAVSRNPELAGEVLKSMLVGQAIAESASIFALVVAMILLFSNIAVSSMVTVFAVFAAGLAMGFGAIGSGIGSGFPAGQSCIGMVRQPAMSGKLTTNMLIGSAVCQTPSIFALVVSFILIFSNFTEFPFWPTWGAILGAGSAVGLSAIGSGVGGGIVAGASSESIARQPLSVGPVTNTMLLGQAIAQTPSILGLLVAFILIFKKFDPSNSIAPAMALLASGLCMGFGGIGPGIGEGTAASGGVKWIARREKETGMLIRTMLVGMAVAESTAIYAMVVSLLLIFVV